MQTQFTLWGLHHYLCPRQVNLPVHPRLTVSCAYMHFISHWLDSSSWFSSRSYIWSEGKTQRRPGKRLGPPFRIFYLHMDSHQVSAAAECRERHMANIRSLEFEFCLSSSVSLLSPLIFLICRLAFMGIWDAAVPMSVTSFMVWYVLCNGSAGSHNRIRFPSIIRISMLKGARQTNHGLLVLINLGPMRLKSQVFWGPNIVASNKYHF